MARMSNESITYLTSRPSIFFSKVFRSATDHQTGDKDREHDEDHHSVKSGPDSAENHFAEKMFTSGTNPPTRVKLNRALS